MLCISLWIECIVRELLSHVWSFSLCMSFLNGEKSKSSDPSSITRIESEQPKKQAAHFDPIDLHHGRGLLPAPLVSEHQRWSRGACHLRWGDHSQAALSPAAEHYKAAHQGIGVGLGLG